MLEQAAEASVSEIDSTEELDGWTGRNHQSLTLVFAGTRPAEGILGERNVEDSRGSPVAINSPINGWTTADLERCLAEPVEGGLWKNLFSGGRDDQADRKASLLWSDFVTEVEVSVDGESAEGILRFDRPSCFRGWVPFSMVREGGRWSVDSLGLPDAGWTVRRNESADGWRAFRTDTIPRIPDLNEETEYVVVRLGLGPSGFPLIGVNRAQIRSEDLPDQVAGRIVRLEVDPRVSGSQFLRMIGDLRSADPPVLAVFTKTGRMVGGCWCLLGMHGSMVERLLEDDTLASPLVDVPRARLPRRSVTLRVGAAGLSVKDPNSLWVSPNVSIRYQLGVVSDAVAGEPGLPVVIAVEPEARYSDIDLAFDIAAQSGTKHIYLPTGSGFGVVFEYREEGGPCS